MKTSIIGVLLLLQLMIGGQALATKVKIGYFELPPHMYQGENSNAQGASVNYFNQVFKQMDYEVEWVGPLPYMRLLKMIEKGQIDALPLMQESEKEPLFQFPDAPYYSPQPVLFVKKSNPLQQVQSIDDIRGLTIGFIAGVEPSPFIKTHEKELKMEYMAQQDWLELNLMKLKRNRIDAVYGLNQVSTQGEI
ncbi:substrate-binding periplasmic protein [Motilimonas eburnea]|uniref:substrate-binding periplasmic protein n=1 Tax=Motilimonas eburnea TaxID=1737488 RepID=UPI001E5E42B6|nr:transporter substrate-binding domain-containing protein [Motilimonas eburnea]MCE2573890.1 transporter substrate-binding domain-containing protein [Motilimonas eburnea]